jgi:hypothetical protein
MNTPPDLKRCSCCHELKAPEEFGLNATTPDGLMYYCRGCVRIRQKEYRTTKPEICSAAQQRYRDKLRVRNMAKREQVKRERAREPND